MRPCNNRGAEAHSRIPNSETSVCIFLSKEQGTNTIKVLVKLRLHIFILPLFGAVERTPITPSQSVWGRGLTDSLTSHSLLNVALASGVEIAERCVCILTEVTH